MPHPLVIYLGWVVAISLVTFCVYAWDKHRARHDGWRVSERQLHVLSLVGGFPGAFAAQRLIRHKSSKTRFQVVYWLTVVAHVAAIAGVTWLAVKLRQ